MKKLSWSAILILSTLLVRDAAAFDPACEPILKAGEARAAISDWSSVTLINGNMKLEYQKSAGQFFMRHDGGKWVKMPNNIDAAEKDFTAQVRRDEIKMTQCKAEPDAEVDGVAVKVISYTVEMQGAPASSATISIGKEDNLPYLLSSKTVEAHYRYKDLVAPKM